MTDVRDVLVVSHQFLPVHNVAVRQLVGYCRYLPEYGWRPIVLSNEWTRDAFDADGGRSGLSFEPELRESAGRETLVATAAGRPHDNALLRAHRRLQEWSGGTAPAAIRAGAAVLRKALSQAAPLYGNFPDEYVGWAPAAVATGHRLMVRHEIEAIVSVCPPATNHVVASRLARETGRPWVPIFGDLYSFDLGPHALPRTPLQRALVRRRNRHWMGAAKRTLAVSPGMVRYLDETYGVPGDVVVVGFDEQDFAATAPARGAKLAISHVGSLYVDQRPELFLDGLDRFLARHPEAARDVEVRFIGSRREAELRERVAARACRAVVSIEEKVSPAEAIRVQRASDVLLLFPVVADWNRTAYGTFSYPSKIFEYFGAERPILAVPADGGWVDHLLTSTKAGRSADGADQVADALADWYAEWRATGALRWSGDRAQVAAFTHRRQAERIAAALDSVQ